MHCCLCLHREAGGCVLLMQRCMNPIPCIADHKHAVKTLAVIAIIKVVSFAVVNAAAVVAKGEEEAVVV